MSAKIVQRRNATFKSLLKMVNAALRQKFPEKDMLVLRKYKLAEADRCLKFSQQSNGRFFGIDFDYGTEGLADLPTRRGCRTGDVFPASDELASTFEDWQLLRKKNKEDRSKKLREYAAFVEASKTVEDVEEIVPLPADLRLKLTKSNTAIVAVSNEIVADLRAEFAKAA